MALQFNSDSVIPDETSCGNLTLNMTDGGSVTIGVSNYYNSSYPNQTHEDQLNKVWKFLNGESSPMAMFCNCNGESEFGINFETDTFTLSGGQFGPTFGSSCRISWSYKKNKEEIDKFMKFMLSEQ